MDWLRYINDLRDIFGLLFLCDFLSFWNQLGMLHFGIKFSSSLPHPSHYHYPTITINIIVIIKNIIIIILNNTIIIIITPIIITTTAIITIVTSWSSFTFDSPSHLLLIFKIFRHKKIFWTIAWLQTDILRLPMQGHCKLNAGMWFRKRYGIQEKFIENWKVSNSLLLILYFWNHIHWISKDFKQICS